MQPKAAVFPVWQIWHSHREKYEAMQRELHICWLLDMLAYSFSRKYYIFQSWSDANFLHLSCCKTVTSKSWFDDKLWISKDKLPFSFSNLRTHFIHFHQRVCLGLFQITIECFWTLKPKWIGLGWMDGWKSLNVTHLWQAWLWEAMLNEK